MRFTRIVARLMLLAFTIGLVLLFVGCGSKKKSASREKIESKKEVSSDSVVASKTNIKNDAVSSEETKQNSKHLEIEYDGCEGDSIAITQKGQDGKILSQTVIKGKGKVKIKETEKSSAIKKESLQYYDFDSWSQTSVGKVSAENYSSAKSSVEKNKTGFNLGFCGWFWLILIVIAVSFIIYLKNRFKSFANIKKHVLNLFSGPNNLASK